MSPDEQGKPIAVLAREMTDRVAARIARELTASECAGLNPLMDLMGSMIFMAGQKLINLKGKTGKQLVQHEATIFSCSRLFNDCFAGCELAKRGLILPSISILRSAFEVVTLGMLMMENGEVAERWFKGDRITQSEIRKSLVFAQKEHARYKFLSDRIHPNVLGIPAHSVVLEDRKAIGLAYGGWPATKSAGLTMCQFLYAQIAFLEAFYHNFAEVLAANDLLWTPETKGLYPSDVPMTWDHLLSDLKESVNKINERLLAMPEEGTGVANELRPPAKEDRS